jgi:TPR repeat protein
MSLARMFLLTISVLLLAGVVAHAASYEEVLAELGQTGGQSQEIGRIRALVAKKSPEAFLRLGAVYMAGKDLPQDFAKAANWFHAASDLGNRDAAFFLGVMHDHGVGGPRDPVKAAQWYRRAADRGQSVAQHALGMKYATADGVERDDRIAARWFYRAAQQGLAESQFQLAQMYSTGTGLPQSSVDAYAWAAIAAASTNEPRAHEEAEKLQESLTDGSISSDGVIYAQKVALAWRPKLERDNLSAFRVSDEQAGIAASLAVSTRGAALRWQPWKPSSGVEITGTLRGLAVGPPRLELFSKSGARSSIVFLFDVSDVDHGSNLERAKDAVVAIAKQAQPYHELDIATYGDGFQLFDLIGNDTTAVLASLKQVVSHKEPANLANALIAAISIPSLTVVDHRSIFVLSDGHFDDHLDLAALTEAGKASRTSFSFILSQGRGSDTSKLGALAEATGGVVVKDDKLADFLRAPFEAADGGGFAFFTYHLPVKPLWQTDPTFAVTLRQGGQELVLKSEVRVPSASFIDSLRLLAHPYTAQLAAAGNDQAALQGFLESCTGACPSTLRAQAQARLKELEKRRQLSERTTQEEQAYLAAQDDVQKLQAYLATCSLCAHRDEAESKATSIIRISEAREYASSHNNIRRLERYVLTCEVCAFVDDARDEVRTLKEREQRSGR